MNTNTNTNTNMKTIGRTMNDNVQRRREIEERNRKEPEKKMGFFSKWLNDLYNSIFGRRYGYTDQVTFGGRKNRTRHNRKHRKHHGTRRNH